MSRRQPATASTPLWGREEGGDIRQVGIGWVDFPSSGRACLRTLCSLLLGRCYYCGSSVVLQHLELELQLFFSWKTSTSTSNVKLVVDGPNISNNYVDSFHNFHGSRVQHSFP